MWVEFRGITFLVSHVPISLPVEYYIAHLIFVKLTIFVRRLAFVLKGNNNETNEYIDHKEGNDDDINKIEAGYDLSVIMNWSMVFFIRVN